MAGEAIAINQVHIDPGSENVDDDYETMTLIADRGRGVFSINFVCMYALAKDY